MVYYRNFDIIEIFNLIIIPNGSPNNEVALFLSSRSLGPIIISPFVFIVVGLGHISAYCLYSGVLKLFISTLKPFCCTTAPQTSIEK